MCVSAGHNRENYRNGRNTQTAVWGVDSPGSKGPFIRWWPGSLRGKTQFGGISWPIVITWSLMNCFRTAEGLCRADLHKRGPPNHLPVIVASGKA